MRTCLLVVACLLVPSGDPFHAVRISESPQGTTEWIGLTKPSKQVKAGSEQAGRIVEMSVQEGDIVSEGDVLFQLGKTSQELLVKRLAVRALSDVDERRAQAELEEALLEEERVRDLMLEGIRSETDLRAVEHKTRVARIMLEKAKLDRMTDKLRWEEAKAMLAERTVVSPITGIVTVIHHGAGDMIDMLEPVVEVVDLDPLLVEFHCPVEYADMFRRGNKLLVRRATKPEDEREAVVRYASMVADPGSQTFLTRLEVPNDDHLWRAGVKVIIELSTDPPEGPGGKDKKIK